MYVRRTAVLIAFALSANAATVLFSNLSGPGPGYGPDGYGLGNRLNTLPPGYSAVAATRFSLTSDAVLHSIEVPVGVWTGSNDLSGYLLVDEAGAPGATVEPFTLGNVPSLGSGNTPLSTAVPAMRPLLKANTPYWFAVYASPDTDGSWLFTPFQGSSEGSSDFATSIIGGTGPEWQVGTGPPEGREGALVVIGEAVPEPGSGILIACGLLVLAQMRKSRAG